MKYFLILLIFPILFSCQEPVEEVIDLTEIIEGSENYKEGEKVEVEVAIIDSTDSLVKPFNENGFEFISAEIINKTFFPDRFGSLSSSKIKLLSQSDTISFLRWNFTDSLKTMNAFYNWIDNFGDKGKSIRIGEKRNFQKQPFIMFVGDTSITFIESNSNVSFNEWEEFCSIGGEEKDWNYVIEQRVRSKARWFVYYENNREVL